MIRRQWTGDEVIQLVERYPNEGASGLAVEFQRSDDSVSSMARRLLVKCRQHSIRRALRRAEQSQTVNPFFFDSVSEPVAYVLGVIWGCGCIKTESRMVLRFSVPIHREPLLRQIQTILASQHRIQRSGRRLIVEVCNSRLVAQLQRNFGKAPSSNYADPPLPILPFPLASEFARGFLDSSGRFADDEVSFRGRPSAITSLTALIRDASGVSQPKVESIGSKQQVTWRNEHDICRLKCWLEKAPFWLDQH